MHYMQTIINEYNEHHVTDVTPRIDHYVSNDMTSNYYFTWQGRELYVDQYDLQESFDGYLNDDGQEINTWDDESIENKAWALAELVQAQTVGL